jgi:hypothetical protein
MPLPTETTTQARSVQRLPRRGEPVPALSQGVELALDLERQVLAHLLEHKALTVLDQRRAGP